MVIYELNGFVFGFMRYTDFVKLWMSWEGKNFFLVNLKTGMNQ